jgi:tetratricopeptide (TPR) repeat protein
MVTAPNKENNFNPQSFPRVKGQDSYRVFCLGGSTTYGRPYDDTTSFAGWLRELLPTADRSKSWEVVNAGGISYASYRVAHLMEELVKYQPDLFIIYTGQNEFLEERTYRKIKDIPPLVRSTVSLLAKTRTWSAMNSALQATGIKPKQENQDRQRLAVQVDTILDRSAGLDRYTRDDALRQNILKHFRISLERMVALADSVGAEVIFVTPASSLNDCAPFKSEHTAGLTPEDRKRSEQLLTQAKEALRQENWQAAADILKPAVALDPQHAELQYRYGQALLAMGRYEAAEDAFRIARDEDVCPLRALTPMRGIVAEIAEEQDVGFVDYVKVVEQRMLEKAGHPIPGEELFLDHVHPTIEGHKLLAVALVEAMADEGLVQLASNWGEREIAAVTATIASRVDQEKHGQALANLARVLLWAGKLEDAERLAFQARELAGGYRQVDVDSTSILSSVYVLQDRPEEAVQILYSTLERSPGAVELRLKLAQTLLDQRFMEMEIAAANLLLVCQQLPHFDQAFELFGLAMARRNRMDAAYPSLMQALRMNPNNRGAQSILRQIQPMLGGFKPNPQPPLIWLDVYPSLAPRQLTQLRRSANGRNIPDGIDVEFHENGRLKRLTDFSQGQRHGYEMTWNTGGEMISRVAYRQGQPVK